MVNSSRDELIASTGFCAIEPGIGGSNQRIGIKTSFRRRRQSNTDGHWNLKITDLHGMRGYRLAHSPCNLGRCFRVATRQQGEELLTPIPSNEIIAAEL